MAAAGGHFYAMGLSHTFPGDSISDTLDYIIDRDSSESSEVTGRDILNMMKEAA